MKSKSLLLLVLFLFLATPVFAAVEAALGGPGTAKEYRWEINSGDLIPTDDSAYDIGASGSEVSTIYVDTINTDALDVSDGNITNVGDISCDSISSDASTIVTYNDGMVLSVEDLTTSSADPGVATAGLTTVISTITTDDTGSSADQVSLADGTKGQIKIFTLKADTEAAGVKVIPANFANGTDVLLEDVGDSVTFVFDGTSWVLTSNIGGTVE